MHERPYEAEAVLQVLLADHPEILACGEPGDEGHGWVLVRREAGVADAEGSADRWALDHLFLDADGVPTLVEVKRSSDTRARREVVAQMLDYAANATAFWKVDTQGERQTIVPRLVGQTEAARAAKGARSRTGGPAFDPMSASPDVRELIEKMDDLAGELGLTVRSARTGRNYQLPVLESGVRFNSGIGVYSSGRGAEFNLSVFRELGANEVADGLLQRLREVTGMQVDAPAWPAVPCRALVADWDRARSQLIVPYFDARRELAGEGRQAGT